MLLRLLLGFWRAVVVAEVRRGLSALWLGGAAARLWRLRGRCWWVRSWTLAKGSPKVAPREEVVVVEEVSEMSLARLGERVRRSRFDGGVI
jgi:hypothetical protein